MRKLMPQALPHRQLTSRQGTNYSRSLDLFAELGFIPGKIYHELLSPGCASSAPHAHSHQHEAFWLLQGELQLSGPDGIQPLYAGEIAIFAPGEVHQVLNTGSEESELLILAEQHPQDRVRFTADLTETWSSLPQALNNSLRSI